MTYDFNMLVSYQWADYYVARSEIHKLLSDFGDPNAVIKRTAARGLAGVKTTLDSREVIALLSKRYSVDIAAINYTLKWTPVDLWCDSTTIESIRQGLATLAEKILPEEKWMMHVEKRRYSLFHKADLIKELAGMFKQKVDLRNPDKIVWIELVGKEAGISIIKPSEIFSLFRASRSD